MNKIPVGELIVVSRHKIDHKKATVKIENLRDFRWGTTSGGAQVYSGTIGLYADMTCTDLEGGEIGHSGIHTKCPHNIKVYIPKQENKKYYSLLAEKAKDRPEDPNKNAFGTADRIRNIVSENPGITTIEVADMLEKEGVRRKTVQNSVRRLKTSTYKTKSKLRAERYKNTQKLYIE
jgi:hypothetical protein